MFEDSDNPNDPTYWPHDVKRATDVIRRWLRARKRSAQLATELYLDIGAEGSLDVHFESVNEAYRRGQLEGFRSGYQNGLDVGTRAGPGTVHTDPDSLS